MIQHNIRLKNSLKTLENMIGGPLKESYEDKLLSIINRIIGATIADDNDFLGNIFTIRFEKFIATDKAMLLDLLIEEQREKVETAVMSELSLMMTCKSNYESTNINTMFLNAITPLVNDDINEYVQAVIKAKYPAHGFLDKVKSSLGIKRKNKIKELLNIYTKKEENK